MTASYPTYALFAAICLILLTLPFIPAFMEWLWPSDIEPLPISANYASDIDHFARRLLADAAAKTGAGASTGYENFDFVPEKVSEMDWLNAKQRLIAAKSLATETPIQTTQPLLVQGDISTASGSSFQALYAQGDIDLGLSSQIHDWAHADGGVRLGQGSVALRRISAGVSIELGEDTWFERLSAPTLFFGQETPPLSQPQAPVQTPASFKDLPNAIEQTPSLYLIRGDCVLPPNRLYQGSLIVTGFLSISAGTRVSGDIKAREGLRIGPNSQVDGAITCEKRIHLWHGVQVLGPVVSESHILVGQNSVIGRVDAPTTISAQIVIAESGSRVHGTVWARELGMVKAA
jgi:predicted acyltransferase (DUF342 family)